VELDEMIGLGVAGNFAHHLEQAGELEDFKGVHTESPEAPKGIFPFYLPYSHTFLGIYPIASDRIELPKYQANAQMEPEIVIIFDLIYDESYQIIDLVAKRFTVFNDCTIRKEGASKISEKKSWGPCSKGIGSDWIQIDRFQPGGVMDDYHLCSYLRRDGVLHPYGVDAPLRGYSYFYDQLRHWLIDKLKTQSDFGPLENIAEHLKACHYPKQALISIGATAYAEFGEHHYLQSGDELYVIAYDATKECGDLEPSSSKVILRQRVEQQSANTATAPSARP
jgi:hypothetical protein